MTIQILSACLLAYTQCYGQHDEIPLEKKVTPMLVLGSEGCALCENSDIIDNIFERGIGEEILFERNISHASQWVTDGTRTWKRSEHPFFLPNQISKITIKS